MARIRIEDLPVVENLATEEMEEVFGAGRFSFRPGMESLEAREMMDAALGQSLLAPVARPDAGAHQTGLVHQTAPGMEIQMNRMVSSLVGNQNAPQTHLGAKQGGIADLSGKTVTQALKSGSNWIIYEPRENAAGQYVDEQTLRKDLKMLFDKGFRGLVTYSFDNGREKIPTIAKEIGFQQVIAGVWAVDNYETEKKNLTQDRIKDIDGFCVGNETQLRHNYSVGELKRRVDEIRNLSGGKPTTTSDAWHLYLPENGGTELMKIGDWVFPNFHPYYQQADGPNWNPHRNIDNAVKFVNEVILQKRFDATATGGRIVSLHESWWPSDSEGQRGDYSGAATPQQQKEYFEKLSKTNVSFVYGEVYDQDWKRGEGQEVPERGHFGGHWGLWNADGSAKPAVETLYLGDRPQ